MSAESRTPAIDYGEEAIRWVICDESGRKLFVDKQGRILIFTDKAIAREVAKLDLFMNQAPNELNVAGVGPTKWVALQEKLPFLEVSNLETAVALIEERIAYQQKLLSQPEKNS